MNDGLATGICRRLRDLARSQPLAPAVCFGDEVLTYAALDDAACAVAGRLAAAGVRGGALAAIHLPRSFQHVIACLAVWRAGGAVLMVDPAWPAARLRQVIATFDVDAIVTNARLAALLDPAPANIVVVDSDREAVAHQPDPRVAGDLAYVICTSGSTGAPKAVEITHANLNHLIAWHCGAFGVTADDRASHLAGLGFDAAIWEVWPALYAGASVVLVPEEVRLAAKPLRDWLIERRITLAFVPTILAEDMIGAAWPADMALRTMLVGGDTLRRRPAVGLPFAVVNNYGPAECTVVATSGVVDADGDGVLPPDIGRPIAGVRIHVLDAQGREVSVDEPGQIAIGGAGVGRGYRARPDLTREAFRPDPFGPVADAKLYLTGDLGRRREDGRIMFLGRRDTQEKIRGARVEPDSVARVLGQHERVAWCHVMGSGPDGARTLIAYVLAAPGAKPTAEMLRDFLSARVPDHEIPASFVGVVSIPLTDNGKLDRDALVRGDAGYALPHRAGRPPDTPVERRVAAIVSQLVGVEDVGADDNFFLLGGQSLLGTQLILRLRQAFGLPLSLRELFETQTVERIAELISDRLAESVLAMSEDEAESLVRR